jgi:hypothetical protein
MISYDGENYATLDDAVDGAIGGSEGWWKESTGETYRTAAKRLTDLGLAPAEALDFLLTLHSATSEEFGG